MIKHSDLAEVYSEASRWRCLVLCSIFKVMHDFSNPQEVPHLAPSPVFLTRKIRMPQNIINVPPQTAFYRCLSFL
jgi:hypothetical protein